MAPKVHLKVITKVFLRPKICYTCTSSFARKSYSVALQLPPLASNLSYLRLQATPNVYMHRFNTDKQSQKRAMDGILSSKPRNSKTSLGPTQASQPRLDNFRRPEGFHGQQSAQLSSSGALKTAAPVSGNRPRPQPNLNSRGSSAQVRCRSH